MGSGKEALKGQTPTLRSVKGATQVSRVERGRTPKTLVSGLGPRKRPRLAASFLAASGAVFIASLGLLFGRSFMRPAEPSVSKAQEPQLTPTTAIYFRATPADATLYLDDEPLLDNPSRVTRPRDGKSHRAVALASGYTTKEVTVVFDGSSVQMDIALESVSTPLGSTSAAVVERPVRKTAAIASGLPAAPSTSSSAPHRPTKVIIDQADPWQR
jgi:hypothetical protein